MRRSYLKWLWIRGKVLFCAILTFMILMRMIWIQLRNFEPMPTLKAIVGLENSPCPMPSFSIIDDRLNLLKPVLSQSPYLVSPGFQHWSAMSCREGRWSFSAFLVYNQNLLLATVTLAVLMTRMVTGGWVLPMIVGAILLSRGRWISSLSEISSLQLIQCSILTLFVFLTHLVRTGWYWGFLLLTTVLILAATVEPALAFSALGIPITMVIWRLWPLPSLLSLVNSRPGMILTERRLPLASGQGEIWQKLRIGLGLDRKIHLEAIHIDSQPSLFAPLEAPLSIWMRLKKVWWRYCLASLLLAAMALFWIVHHTALSEYFMTHMMVYSIYQPSLALFYRWFIDLSHVFDLDLMISLAVVVVSAFSFRLRGLPGFADLCLVALVVIATCIFGGFCLDLIDTLYTKELGPTMIWSPEQRSLSLGLWFEPLLLSLGVTGLFNIFKIIDSILLENKISDKD